MKTKKTLTRILSFLLVIMMLFSTIEMTSFISFAEEGEEVVSEENLTETSEESSENLSEEVSEETSADTTEEVSEEASEEMTEEAGKEASEDVSEDTSEDVSEEISKDAEEDFSEVNPQEAEEEEEEYGFCEEGTLYLFSSDANGIPIADYIGQAITYWQEKGCVIDLIAIDIPKTDGKAIISKDIFNVVYNTSDNIANLRLRLDFEAEDELSWYSWYFTNLQEEQSDFDATLRIEESGRKGLLKVTLPDTGKLTSKIECIIFEAHSDSPYFSVVKEGLSIIPEDYAMFPKELVMLDADLQRINCKSYVSFTCDEPFVNITFYYEDDDNGKTENFNEVYYTRSIDKGVAYNDTPIELKYPEEGVSNVTFYTVDSKAEIKNGFLYFTSDSYQGEICVLCTYTDAAGKECAELWRYNVMNGLEGIHFDGTEKVHEWDGNSSVQGILEWETVPFEQKEIIGEDGFTWEIENVTGTPIELVLQPAKDEYSDAYYDGTYNVIGYGEAKVKVSYNGTGAVCTIKVLKSIKVPQIDTVYAVSGVDTTLADLDLNTLFPCKEDDDKGVFVWEDAQLKLDATSRKPVYYNAFYQVEGREKQAVRIPVVMTEIKNLEISMIETVGDDYQITAIPADLKKGEQISMGLSVQANPAEGADVIANYIQQKKLSLAWTDKESKNMIDAKTPVYLPRSYTAETKGKKIFKASVVNAETKKTIKTAQATLQVYEKEQFDFESVDIEDQIDPDNEMKGKVLIHLTEENYQNAGKKLTVKSLDTSVMQPGKMIVSAPDENAGITIEIPYTFKKFGKTHLSVTAGDARKTSKTFELERIEYKPALLTTEAVIDKAIMPPYGAATLRYFYPEGVERNGNITLKGKNADKFVIDLDNNIRINETVGCANGTYTVVLQIPYTYNGNAYTVDRTLKVKVTHTKNQIKVVQVPVINEFCRYEEGDILASLNISALKGNVISATLVNNNLPYTLEPNMETGNFDLVVKPGESIDKLTAAQKKIDIFVKYYNIGTNIVFYGETVKFTLKSKKIKPKIFTDSKEILLNPEIYNNEGYFYFGAWDGMGSLSVPDALYIVDPVSKKEIKINQKGYEERYTSDDIYQIGKNMYYVVCDEWDVYVGLVDPNQAVNAKDTITFKIRMPHWKEAITSKKTIKVQKKALNYEIIDKTLTLNMNKELYQSVSAETYFGYKVTGKSFSRYFDSCIVEPADSKAKKALENNLIIETEYEHNIIARIKDLGNVKDGTALKKGTYKFILFITVDGKEKKYPLNIKVFDMAPSKVITYDRFGTIDLLDRENSYIQLNPSINWDNYAYGEILDIKLTGPDAHMFDGVYEDYRFRIYAKQEYDYSTAKTYQVYPVVKWRTFDPDGAIEIKGSLQKIKVTQSKVTYKAVTDGAILYGNRTIYIGFTSNNSKTGEMVEIEQIELLNYTEDLSVEYYPGKTFVTLKLKDGQPSQIKKSSGTYTLKFAVTPKGAAVNSKPTIVTYKVKIVR